jgi:hypothetical protein
MASVKQEQTSIRIKRNAAGMDGLLGREWMLRGMRLRHSGRRHAGRAPVAKILAATGGRLNRKSQPCDKIRARKKPGSPP